MDKIESTNPFIDLLQYREKVEQETYFWRCIKWLICTDFRFSSHSQFTVRTVLFVHLFISSNYTIAQRTIYFSGLGSFNASPIGNYSVTNNGKTFDFFSNGTVSNIGFSWRKILRQFHNTYNDLWMIITGLNPTVALMTYTQLEKMNSQYDRR